MQHTLGPPARRPSQPGAGRLRRDWVLLGLIGVHVLSTVGFFSDWGVPGLRLALFRLMLPPLGVALIVLAWRAARLPGLAKPVRRFWLSLSAAGVFFTIGDCIPVCLGLFDPIVGTDSTARTVQSVLQICGTVLPLSMMLTYPTGFRTWRARARFWLDATTVMTAAVVFIWYFSIGDSAGDSAELVGALVESSSTLVAVFAVVKLLLGGSAPFTRNAALLGSAAAAIDGVTKAMEPLLDSVGGPLLLSVRLLPAVLIAATPRVQELQVLADPAALVRKQRLYSRLPYLAVFATNGLLVAVLVQRPQDSRLWAVLGGALVVTAVVVIRQLAAFSDNARLLARLDASEQRFRSLVAHSSEITMILDGAGLITYVSPALQRLMGHAPEQAQGRSPWDFIHAEDVAHSANRLATITATPRESITWQLRLRAHDGSWRWFGLTCTNLLDDPSVCGVVINAHDIHEARQYQEELRYQASHDPLTGLANRALFHQRIAAATAHGANAAILLIDLDHFKAVNDSLGHHVGDALLVVVAERLRAAVRPGGTVARLGGDEFAVLLPGDGRPAMAALGARIAAALAVPAVIDGVEIAMRASVGGAVGSIADPDLLLREADASMYAAKRSNAAPDTAHRASPAQLVSLSGAIGPER